MGKEKTTIYRPILIKKGEILNSLPQDKFCANVINLPEGATNGNELGEVVYEKGMQIDYHDHQWGYECFTILYGSTDAYLNNKHVILEEGDMFFIPPHTQHGFVSRVEGCTWREIFEEIRMYYGSEISSKMHNQDEYRGFIKDPDMEKRVRDTLGDFYRPLPISEDLYKRDVPQVRLADFPSRVFETSIGRFDLRIPRWDYDGLKEIWDFRPVKGLQIDFSDPFGDYPLYVVIKGKMIAHCDGKTYVAEEGDFLHIPPWHMHKLEFPEGNTKVQICNEQSHLLHILEHFKTMKKNDPDSVKDWKNNVKPVLRKYNNMATSISIEGNKIG